MEPRTLKSNLNFIKFGEPVRADESMVASTSELPSLDFSEEPVTFTIQELLDCIEPPKTWTSPEGETWYQKLSTEPGTRQDIETLISNLNARLEQLSTRKVGFCPIRSMVYKEAFSELLRQVTLRFPEQGLLLLRVRNEAQMTLKAYQTLYENSTALGVKAIQEAHERIGDLEEQVQKITKELIHLDKVLNKEQHRYTMVIRRINELMEAISRKREHDLGYLNMSTRQMTEIVESLQGIVSKPTEPPEADTKKK